VAEPPVGLLTTEAFYLASSGSGPEALDISDLGWQDSALDKGQGSPSSLINHLMSCGWDLNKG